jgi:hypothetical protein
MPIPPISAIVIAMSDSVTVSIGELTRGVLRVTRLRACVREAKQC